MDIKTVKLEKVFYFLHVMMSGCVHAVHFCADVIKCGVNVFSRYISSCPSNLILLNAACNTWCTVVNVLFYVELHNNIDQFKRVFLV